MWSCSWGGGGERGLARGKTSRLTLSLWDRRALSPSNSIKPSDQQPVSLLLLRFAEERAMGEASAEDGGGGAVAGGREQLHETSVLLHHAQAANHSCNEGLGDKQSFNVDEPPAKIIMQGRTLPSSRLGLFQGHLSPCGDAAAGLCIEPRRGTRRATGLWEMLWEEPPLSQVT